MSAMIGALPATAHRDWSAGRSGHYGSGARGEPDQVDLADDTLRRRAVRGLTTRWPCSAAEEAAGRRGEGAWGMTQPARRWRSSRGRAPAPCEPGQQPARGDPADRAAGGGDQHGVDAVGDHRALDLQQRGVLRDGHDTPGRMNARTGVCSQRVSGGGGVTASRGGIGLSS